MKTKGYTKGYTLILTPIRVDLSCGAAALFFTKKSRFLYQAIGKSPVPETVFPEMGDTFYKIRKNRGMYSIKKVYIWGTYSTKKAYI